MDICLRGTNTAVSHTVSSVDRLPAAWTDDDVAQVLREMLLRISRQKSPGQPDPPVTLRGVSWIVNPFESGGVVIAIEISLGAAVAGPFDLQPEPLSAAISRVQARQAAPADGGTRH